MDVIGLLRDASALRAVVYTYTRASEYHATKETQALLEGKDRDAEIYHRRDMIVIRALLAEQHDPEPKECA